MNTYRKYMIGLKKLNLKLKKEKRKKKSKEKEKKKGNLHGIAKAQRRSRGL